MSKASEAAAKLNGMDYYANGVVLDNLNFYEEICNILEEVGKPEGDSAFRIFANAHMGRHRFDDGSALTAKDFKAEEVSDGE